MDKLLFYLIRKFYAAHYKTCVSCRYGILCKCSKLAHKLRIARKTKHISPAKDTIEIWGKYIVILQCVIYTVKLNHVAKVEKPAMRQNFNNYS